MVTAVGFSQGSSSEIDSNRVRAREREEQRRISGDKAKQLLLQKNEVKISASAGMKAEFHRELYGENELDFSEELWNDLAEEWSFSLVGMIFEAWPSFKRISAFVRSRWGNEKFVSVAQIDSGVFLFNFKSEEDMNRILDQGPWTFDNGQLVLKQWVAGEPYSLEYVKSLPLWVRFPRLPVHLHRVDALSRIASVLGKPLRTDGFISGKSNLMYARVLVEVDASMELKHSITINGPNGISIVQKVEYSWIPHRCEHCHCFGHKGIYCEFPWQAMDYNEDEEEEDDPVVIESLKIAKEVSEVAKDRMEGFLVKEYLVSKVPGTKCSVEVEDSGRGEVSVVPLSGDEKKMKGKGKGKKKNVQGCQDSDMNVSFKNLSGRAKKKNKKKGLGAKLTLLKW